VLIIPAIDIRGGKCVRLLQGDPDKETAYSDNPVEMARRFQNEGASLIHVVDLDGAFRGTPVNTDIIASIAGSLNIPIEIGGGIRDEESIKVYLDLGITRIIVGTLIFRGAFKNLIDKFGNIFIAGIDVRNSVVATHGWKTATGVDPIGIMKEIYDLGIHEFIYTDISTDGMLAGPDIAGLKDILREIRGIDLIASGGVSSMSDLERLSGLERDGLKGCIIGKAIYDGRIYLPDAISNYG
jgi:phosphoribosylformimino-5-aminoimidazole carboxamide ribotide isomerase